jgi:hypothetical protein
MSVLSCFAAFGPIGRASVARIVRRRGVVAGLLAIAVAASVAAPGWAESAKRTVQPQKDAAAALDLNADGSVPDKVVKAGARSNVVAVWDCDLPNLAPVVSARVEHGFVRIGTGNGARCGRPSMSLTSIFYTSAPGFKGTDTLHVLAFLSRGDIDQTFTILVK